MAPPGGFNGNDHKAFFLSFSAVSNLYTSSDTFEIMTRYRDHSHQMTIVGENGQIAAVKGTTIHRSPPDAFDLSSIC